MIKLKNIIQSALFFTIFLMFSGCAYKAYMGIHGSSIKLYPEVHENITEDKQCLDCHHPDIAEGPVTPHPGFQGCIKCHNDEI